LQMRCDRGAKWMGIAEQVQSCTTIAVVQRWSRGACAAGARVQNNLAANVGCVMLAGRGKFTPEMSNVVTCR